MRRVVILVLLLGAMQLILPLGMGGTSGQWLLILGFLIIAADAAGTLSASVGIPKIVGYMIAGFAFGPSAIGTMDAAAIRQLEPVSALAIALIAFLAGAELRWGELKENGRKILKILTVEMSLSFLAVTGFLVAFREQVPFLSGASTPTMIALAMLFASVAVVHSPAVTMALLTETRAKGPVTRTTLGVVLLSDVAVIIFFSAVLALARTVAPPSGGSAGGITLGGLLWELVGAMVVGAIFGGVVAIYLRWVRRELFLFALIVAFFGAEIARLAHVETLLMLLTAGFVAENVSDPEDGEALRLAMEKSAAPIFVVFFALAGAALQVQALAAVWMLVLPIVIVRLAALWVGSNVGARWGGASAPERRYTWLGLVSQAGVAIGLVTIVAQVYPERGDDLRTMFLAMIAVNQTVGPLMFRHALARSGEIADGTGEAAQESMPPMSTEEMGTPGSGHEPDRASA